MTIQIYNTLSGKKEALQTLEPGHVKLYVCGITSYDYCHIGHARSALAFDMIVRYLRYRGYKVTFVRNFTDIDDKIIARAKEQHTTSEELANRFINEFYTDMDTLGVDRPDIEPKATEHIQEMTDIISELIAKGMAYQAGNDVYYIVDSFPEYGKLSKRNLEDMKAGSRISVNEQKHNPMDFVLWKGSKPGEPTWDSPWGPGRPGWHIECSAMSRKYLGETFDIHGGGQDLIFPHHENEIAQSEGANGKPFVKSWIHHGFVTNSDKTVMDPAFYKWFLVRSFALGNFILVMGKMRSCPPPWISKVSPRYLRLIAEHSICQPGRPGPQGLSQVGSPGFEPFQSTKSMGLFFCSFTEIRAPACMSSRFLLESLPYSGKLSTM